MPDNSINMVVRSGGHAGDVDPGTIWGLYIVFSDKFMGGRIETPAFRVGVAGISDRSTLKRRLTTHAGKWSEHNWTTQRRCWRPVWTAEVASGGGRAMLMAEHVLYAAVARRYAFENASGFMGFAQDIPEVCQYASAASPAIAEVLALQLGVDCNIEERAG